MKEVKSSLIKQKLNLDRYLQDNVEKSKIDIISLRDIVAEIILDTDFLENIKDSNNNIFVEKDSFLKEVMKNKKDYVEQIIFGKEEQIKVAIVTPIDQLAHLDFNHKFKKESLNSSLEKRTNDKYKYSKEVIDNEFENQKEMWYNRKTASLDAKHLKELYELAGVRENDENIKNQELLDFAEALDLKEIEDILFDIKDLVMVECIKDKRINKAIYTNEQLDVGNETYLRMAFNTNEEYMLTMAHIRKKTYEGLSNKFTRFVKRVRDIPRELSTSFPIFLDEKEWSLEGNYINKNGNYKTKYRHIKNDFEKYDKPYMNEKEEIYDK